MLVTNAGDECWGCRAGDEWCRRWVTIVELGSGSELCPLPVCKLGPTRIAKLASLAREATAFMWVLFCLLSLLLSLERELESTNGVFRRHDK